MVTKKCAEDVSGGGARSATMPVLQSRIIDVRQVFKNVFTRCFKTPVTFHNIFVEYIDRFCVCEDCWLLHSDVNYLSLTLKLVMSAACTAHCIAQCSIYKNTANEGIFTFWATRIERFGMDKMCKN